MSRSIHSDKPSSQPNHLAAVFLNVDPLYTACPFIPPLKEPSTSPPLPSLDRLNNFIIMSHQQPPAPTYDWINLAAAPGRHPSTRTSLRSLNDKDFQVDFIIAFHGFAKKEDDHSFILFSLPIEIFIIQTEQESSVKMQTCPHQNRNMHTRSESPRMRQQRQFISSFALN